eukprot:2551097-Pyramimonas_sp.AAC.1
MGVDVHARRLTRAQTHTQSDPLALRLTRSQSSALRPIVFVRVVCPAAHSARPSRGSWPRNGRGRGWHPQLRCS